MKQYHTIRMQYLFGFDYKPPANLAILIYTDGSTFVPKPSGAAYVLVT
jgi:acyl-CoA synthetase (AMP-forming)/AMP-acid ligase II